MTLFHYFDSAAKLLLARNQHIDDVAPQRAAEKTELPEGAKTKKAADQKRFLDDKQHLK
jgi:hypothetical protein